ncbi:MAG: endopeptidase La [Thiohalomonadaceae bacterium]
MPNDETIEAELLSSADSTSDLAVRTDVLPTTLYLLPLIDRPFFPAQAFPVLLDEKLWLDTLEHIGDHPHRMAGLVLVRKGDPENLHPENFYRIGTAVRVHNPSRSDGKIQFIAEGIQRFRIVKWLSDKPPFMVQVEYPGEKPAREDSKLKAYAMAIINTLKELLPLNPLYSEELKYFLSRFSPNDPSPLTDFAAALTSAKREELQQVLESFAVLPRMEKVLVLLKKELDVAQLQSQIREKVDERMSEQQRKFFLREQLKEIQKELGLEKDDRTADVERFTDRLGKLTLPEAAQKRVDDELQKLSILEVGSPEYTVTRNYLDWVSSLPWGLHSTDRLELKRARRTLDQDHDGLDDVKQRIIEFIAVGSLKGEVAGSILLLVGPPGVGKTSIGHSIANTLGRKFYRFSLGGMRDEAEIKGHRRTYIGAMPGKFIQAIKETETANPVIMLDEIDKVGASYHGDPASALLEVLDPEQNSDFLDHYLDLRFDLSKVLFICTANQLDTIPGPLLDRMEVIRLSGYITEEKLAIAKNHLWPKQLEKVGLKSSQLKITDSAVRKIIEGYAREAGVRNLEKQLGRIVRKAVVRIVGGEKTPIRIGPTNIESILGKALFQREKLMTGVGVVTGLAWTAMGGATLSIEATRVHKRNFGFKLTGKLGDVMRESAEIAHSYISSHAKQFGAEDDFFAEAFIHLHVPEGATPKDGPSAGITMATALLSLARKQRIKRPLAMTGEMTLTGQVLPVGGIKEKVIAARRVKVMELILPAANQGDYEELPEHIRKGFKVHFAKHFRDVAAIVFGAA